jgi:hypothetical protein
MVLRYRAAANALSVSVMTTGQVLACIIFAHRLDAETSVLTTISKNAYKQVGWQPIILQGVYVHQ